MANNHSIPLSTKEEIQSIKTDNINSATYLTKKSIHLVLDYIEQDHSNEKVFQNNMKQILQELINAQPTMASIINFCNSFFFYLDEISNQIKKNQFKEFLKKYCQSYLLNMNRQKKQILTNAQDIIHDKDVIFTYSNSSILSDYLIEQKNNEKKFTVFCSESRPKNEGINLAETLAQHNIRVTLVTDSSLFSNISKADRVIIGADAIYKKGVINKKLMKIIQRF